MSKIFIIAIIYIFTISPMSYAINTAAVPTPPTADEIADQALQEKVSAIFEEANKNEKYECKNPMDVVKFPLPSLFFGCLQRNNVFDRWPPTCSDAEKVKYLKCRDDRIDSLEGIQQFPNLETLIIEKMYDNGTQISSLAPLRNLIKLRELSLPASKISDIVFLTRLPALQYLDLSYNQITDLTYIRLMKNLRSLDLRYQAPNYITDITMLSKIQNLYIINLEGNKISDISPVNSNKGLTYLYFRDNRVTSLEGLRDMPNLYEINFSINIIRDLAPLADVKSLGGVYGRLNRVTSLEPIRDLQKLIEVDFRENFINDVAPLNDLKNIQAIQLDYNLVRDVTPIQKLQTFTPITVLGFSYNCIPKDNYMKIWNFNMIPVRRFDKQCEIPHQDNRTFITDDIVNKDLVDYHLAQNFDEIVSNANAANIGGCSIGSSERYDRLMIIFLILITTRLAYIKVKRKTQT